MKSSMFWNSGRFIVMSTVLISILLSGCGAISNDVSASPTATCTSLPRLTKKPHYTIGFAQASSDTPWRQAETASIQSEAQSHGDQLVYADANGSESKQLSDVETMIARRVDVIVLSPVSEGPLATAVLDAKSACIPVILIDHDVDHALAKPNQDYVTFIGSDFVSQGKRAADWLIHATKGSARIVEIHGVSGVSSTEQRQQGFDTEINTAPGMIILARQDGGSTRDKGREAMTELLKAHPDLTAVFAQNDEMALGAIAALKAAGRQPGKDVLVVSIDGEKDALKAIVAGDEGASVQTNPFFGPITFQVIDQYASGQKLSDWVIIHDELFTIDNAAENIPNAF